MTQSEGPQEPVGSVAEEAAKLFGALSGWAKEHGEGFASLGNSLGDSLGDSLGEGLHEHIATGAPECTWCPVCRTISAIRQTSPEVRAHLGNAASSLLLAVSGMMETRPPSGEAGVERIELDDEWPEGDR